MSLCVHFNGVGLALHIRKRETNKEVPRKLSCTPVRRVKLEGKKTRCKSSFRNKTFLSHKRNKNEDINAADLSFNAAKIKCTAFIHFYDRDK